MPMLNFLSASLVPMFSAKHDPASNSLLLWLMLWLLLVSSTAVRKRVMAVLMLSIFQFNAKIVNFIKNYSIFVQNL